jgi:hypothetical protein
MQQQRAMVRFDTNGFVVAGAVLVFTGKGLLFRVEVQANGGNGVLQFFDKATIPVVTDVGNIAPRALDGAALAHVEMDFPLGIPFVDGFGMAHSAGWSNFSVLAGTNVWFTAFYVLLPSP